LRLSFVPLILLLWPLVEIAGFVLVGSQIGVLATIGLVIATSIAGGLLMRFQGFGTLVRIRQEMDAGRDPSRNLAHGMMILFAGLLLLLPGFFTDIIGILLFIPPIRDFGWRFLKKRVDFSANFTTFRGGAGPRGGNGPSKTIDLDEDDYSKDPDPDSPWRRLRDK
jgi:UPF0716 protein FxsA